MSTEVQVGWESVRFTYTLEQVREIKDLLACNDQDIVKVFDIVWNKWTVNPPLLLHLIQRIKEGEL